MSIYQLKSRFQNLLRPLVSRLAQTGVTANQVTLSAALVSVLLGAVLIWHDNPLYFALVPIWLFIRMALNAIDGMLAREHGQKSNLGAFFNEIGDVISDAALYLPFAFVLPFTPLWIFTIIVLAILTEFVGVLAASLGANRTYDGPLGKSDRALLFGILGCWLAVQGTLPGWMFWLQPLACLLLIATIIKRMRHGLKELQQN